MTTELVDRAKLSSYSGVQSIELRIRRRNLIPSSDLSAGVAFFIVYPTFFFYQTFVQLGLIAPVLGGYFTAGAIGALPFAIYAHYQQRKALGPTPSHVGILFVAFMCLFALAVAAGMRRGISDEITQPHLAYLVKFGCFFVIAKTLNGDSDSFRRLSLIALAAMIGVILTTASGGLFLRASMVPVDEGGFQLDYHGLALAYLVLVVYAVPSMRRPGRIVVYAASLPALFLIGARSEFVGLLVLIVVVEFCRTKWRLGFLLAMCALPLVLLPIVQVVEKLIPDHRVLGLLRLAADESALQRKELYSAALNTIASNPVLGAYGSYEPGHYAHNVLSAWVDLGAAGFVVLASTLALAMAGMVGGFQRWSRDGLYIQSLATLCVVVCLLLFAKTYTYQMIPVALGLYCRFRLMRRHRILRPCSVHTLTSPARGKPIGGAAA